MSKQFDELTKDLAKGVSRRSALSRFVASVGAAVAGLVMGRKKASAAGKSHAQVCIDFCKACYDGEEFGDCMSNSVQCADADQCAVQVNFGGPSVNSTVPVNGTEEWICTSSLIGYNGRFRCNLFVD